MDENISKNEAIANRPIVVTASIILAIISLVIMVKSRNLDTDHWCIIFLPISVLLGSFVISIFKVADSFRIASLLVYIMYLFRYTVVAAAAVNGEYYIETSPSVYLAKFNLTCVLMAIEFFIMVLVICNGLQKPLFTRRSDQLFTDNNDNSLKTFIFLALIVCIGAIAVFPSLKNNFFLFFGNKENRLLVKAQYSLSSGSVPGIIFYPFVTIVEWLRITLPIFVIVKTLHGKKSNIIKFIIILCMISISFLITTHVQITGMFVIAIVVMYIMEQRKGIKHALWLPVAIGIVYVFIIAITDYSGLGSNKMLSRVLQNYFNGPSNVAAGISMPREGVLSKFFIDLVYSNNFLSAILGVSLKMTSTELFFEFTNDYTRSSIFPALAQASYYFTIFLGPVFSAVVIHFVSKIENTAYRIENKVYRVLLIFCAFRLGVCLNMYFAYSTYAVLWDFIIPYYIIAWIGKKVVIRIGRRA